MHSISCMTVEVWAVWSKLAVGPNSSVNWKINTYKSGAAQQIWPVGFGHNMFCMYYLCIPHVCSVLITNCIRLYSSYIGCYHASSFNYFNLHGTLDSDEWYDNWLQSGTLQIRRNFDKAFFHYSCTAHCEWYAKICSVMLHYIIYCCANAFKLHCHIEPETVYFWTGKLTGFDNSLCLSLM